jgi:hypothetical protein
MSLRDEIPPDELAVVTKALDIHRQSLINKLERPNTPDHEKKRTMQEIESCSSAATRFRAVHDEYLREQQLAS